MAMSQTQSPVPVPDLQQPSSQSVDQFSQHNAPAMALPQVPSPEAMSKMAHGRMANGVRQDPPSQGTLHGNYHLYLPDDPSKSRVETQTQLNLILRPVPPGITKLHLPPETISKPKLMDKPKAPLSPNTLEMTVSVVCTSAMQNEELRKKAFERAVQKQPGELPPENNDRNSPQKGAEVRICSGCMVRERKRAARKRVKNQEDEDAWLRNENFRIIVFNTNETKQWEKTKALEGPPGLKITLPLRIACYCRHHGEKSGFNIIFTLKDCGGNVVAQNMTSPIMVTDDHKTTVGSMSVLPNLPAPSFGPPTLLPASPGSQQGGASTVARMSPAADGPSPKGNGGRRAPRAIKPGSAANSRAASPSQNGPSAKKRKSSKGVPPRVPQSLSMTKVDAPGSQPNQAVSEQSRASSMDISTSPNDFPDHIFGYHTTSPQMHHANAGANGFAPPVAPSAGESPASQFYSNPPSGNPSRVPSPQLSQPMGPTFSPVSPARAPTDDLGQQSGNQGFRQGGPMFQNMGQPHLGMNGLMQHGMDGIAQSQPNGMPQPSLDVASALNDRRPKLSKVVPQEGSISGGYEVTVLGKDLGNGMNIWFGEQKAHYTTFWSSDTVICLVPAANVSGVVNVTVEAPVTADNLQQWNPDTTTSFRYVDDTEDRLMKLALRLIGSKMSGASDVDVNRVARQVLQTQLQGGNQSLGGSNMFNQAAPGATGEQLEMQLVGCLDFIDNDDSPYEANLDIKDSSGHTMLHLAAVQGFRRLAAALLVRGANPNELDNSHCTPLHLAAMHDKPEIVQRLMRAGASSRVLNLSDLTAVDLSESGAVTRAIRHSLTRSQSADFSHSRASSVSSLRSLCEPMSRVTTNQEVDNGEESPEYTTGDFEDEDPDEDVYLHMKRPSAHGQAPANHRESSQEGSDDEGAQPIKTMADLKEHFQTQLNQLQQSWALHVQNHFPQMPQMPQMPALPAGFPDYQAYFQQAPFMRRMTSYMPGMNGSRPESQDGQTSPKMDHRWWDLSSFMNQTPAPPPAYEEIYPQRDLDTKQSSAAAAAAEAEADQKCATLYDQEEELVEQPPSPAEGESSDREPRIITIGRKNAITKEQQQQLLRARDRKHTRLRNDRNLFVVWVSSISHSIPDQSLTYSQIPLLIIMICAMAYRCFPSLPSVIMNLVVAAITIVRSFVVNVRSSGNPAPALGQQQGVGHDRVVEL